MNKIRYMYILKFIMLALDECDLDPYDLPADVDSFSDMVIQYGKRSSVTYEEVKFVMQTPLSKMFFEDDFLKITYYGNLK